jgi:hypothetical protein
MNDLTVQQKVESIEFLIEHNLNESGIDWKNETLYSWNYGPRRETLSPGLIYTGDNQFNKLSVKENYTTSDGISVSLYESKKTNLQKYIDNHSSLQRLQVKFFPESFTEDLFLLSLRVKLFQGLSPEHFVVTNLCPDVTLFGKDALYSAIGKWYTGLK